MKIDIITGNTVNIVNKMAYGASKIYECLCNDHARLNLELKEALGSLEVMISSLFPFICGESATDIPPSFIPGIRQPEFFTFQGNLILNVFNIIHNRFTSWCTLINSLVESIYQMSSCEVSTWNFWNTTYIL